MAARIEFEYRFGRSRSRATRREEPGGPMRILVLADLSGRETAEAHEVEPGLAGRSTVSVDVDNFDEVMRRISPRLELSLAGPEGPRIAMEFSSLDDFHPDALYRKLDPFRALRELRGRLLDQATSAQTIAEMTRWARRETKSGDAGPVSPTPGAVPPHESDADTMERLLGKQPAHPGGASKGTARIPVDLSGFIRSIVSPHIVPKADPQQKELVGSIDDVTGVIMRTVLHHPGFQSLEATWRSAWGLVSGLETGEELKLYLLDAGRRDLAADLLAAGDDLERSGLYRLLADKGLLDQNDGAWSMLLGNYTFGRERKDLSLLAALGAIASQAGGPLLAAADPAVLGCRSLAETPDATDWTSRDDDLAKGWDSLRRSNAASWVGLALPRVLLRLPYGGRTEAIESFEFEELSSVRDHESYLWGNPAFACARLIAEQVLEEGPSAQPGGRLDIGDLPAHTYVEDGGSEMKPCAEILLTERTIDAILSRGLMPMMSHRNRDSVRVVRFQSLAEPPTALSGPWS